VAPKGYWLLSNNLRNRTVAQTSAQQAVAANGTVAPPLKRGVRRLEVLVDVASMTGLYEHHHQFVIADLIHDTPGALSYAVTFSCPGELFAAPRSWVDRKRLDPLDDLASDLFRLDPLNLLGGGVFDS
jgi:hypothetical protein